MSSEPIKTDEGPSVNVQPPAKPTPPTKRFLEQPSNSLSPSKSLLFLSTASTSGALASPPKLNASPVLLSSPPRLIKYPTIVITPVNSKQLGTGKPCTENKIAHLNTQPGGNTTPLPPPPPLIKMPITTRNDKRASVTKPKYGEISDGSSGGNMSVRPESPTKRRKRENSESSSSTTTTASAPTTPRKIIQEIFGPDKSKKSKGKGRKRKRAATPKKKILRDPDLQEKERKGSASDDQDEESVEVNQPEEHDAIFESETAPHMRPDDEVDEIETESEIVATSTSKSKEYEEEPPVTSTIEDTLKPEHVEETDSQDILEDEGNGEFNDDDTAADYEIQDSGTTKVPPRTKSKRRAKQVANEKLKKINENHPDEDAGGEGEEGASSEQNVVDSTSERGGIRSRRSTTEGSTGSSGSRGPAESEGSGNGNDFKNKNLALDRETNNLTPLSIISEDDDHDGKEVGDVISMSDMQDQKDSDVDSTYSWKPVRAAAAVASEQVTKQHGSGNGNESTISSTTAADAEMKASAAAERRARKVMRYKGRNRRTLLFKSSSSKKYTAVRLNKYAAQPTIAPKIFHSGRYFQPGDIVFVELDDGSPIYGQIRGLLMDHFGQLSAGIRWLLPKHPIYATIDFAPLNYAFRYDIPEKLVKIEYVKFVMHLNIDFFDGHHSYGKIEKGSIYTRMWKPLQTSENVMSDHESVNADATSSSTTSESEVNAADDNNSSDNVDTQDKIVDKGGVTDAEKLAQEVVTAEN